MPKAVGIDLGTTNSVIATMEGAELQQVNRSLGATGGQPPPGETR
jgi:molecular chaperone DnaK (HSP70)